MKWACLGLNYKTAPVEMREKFATPAHKIPVAGAQFLSQSQAIGCVILSTCNRMEIYFTLPKEKGTLNILKQLLSYHQLNDSFLPHFYHIEGVAVSEHLCRVLSGLDSMVLGETEIFGQVKKAYALALQAQLTESSLNKLFQKSFTIGKKVRTQTSINEGTTSVGSVAVELAEQIFGDLSQIKVLILGAGEMSRTTAQSLQSRGASSIFVANRSFDRAQELAQSMNAKAMHFDNWTQQLKDIDIVIASTAAPHYIVHEQDIIPLRGQRKYRPLFFIDISVPRNVSPNVADIEEVYLYDIDTLSKIADEARLRRQQEIIRCETIIQKELSLMTTQSTLPPLIIGTRGSALALAQAHMTERALLTHYPHATLSTQIIKTTGDIRTDVPLAQVAQASGIVDKGIFIKEIETALDTGEITLAVHSLKDLPSTLDNRFQLAAILPRASTADVLISKHGQGLDSLPQRATVATSSVRRSQQLRFLRPDIIVVDIRGNVPTRLEKLASTPEWDALLLAQAGLDRLGIDAQALSQHVTPLYATKLDPATFYPAAGQGAVALEIRADNRRIAELLAPLNHAETAYQVRAEREFLRLLNAGCSTPIGLYSLIEENTLTLSARIFSETEHHAAPLCISTSGLLEFPEKIAQKLYELI